MRAVTTSFVIWYSSSFSCNDDAGFLVSVIEKENLLSCFYKLYLSESYLKYDRNPAISILDLSSSNWQDFLLKPARKALENSKLSLSLRRAASHNSEIQVTLSVRVTINKISFTQKNTPRMVTEIPVTKSKFWDFSFYVNVWMLPYLF